MPSPPSFPEAARHPSSSRSSLLPRCHRRCLSSSPPSCPRTTCARACGSTRAWCASTSLASTAPCSRSSTSLSTGRTPWCRTCSPACSRPSPASPTSTRASPPSRSSGPSPLSARTARASSEASRGRRLPSCSVYSAWPALRCRTSSTTSPSRWKQPPPSVRQSPPAARVTRARHAKENRQYDMARQLSMLDEWEAEEFGKAGADGDDDDDAPHGNRRARGSAKKSIYVYDDPSDDEDSLADPDDSARGRRSGRARRPVQKEPTPEVRLTGRQQAIRLQQEQQKEEAEQAAKQEQQDKEASESRKRSKPSGLDADSDSALSDANSDAGSAGEDEHENVNGRSTRKRRRTAVGTSDDEAEQDGEQRPGSVNGKSEADVSMEQDTREMESPDLETKVSILSALIDAAVMADGVSDELKAAHDNIAAQERTNKAANADMEKELAEELAELNKRAPSIVSPKYQAWKAEKAALEHDHAWRRLDARVTSELTVDVHAMRTVRYMHAIRMHRAAADCRLAGRTRSVEVPTLTVRKAAILSGEAQIATSTHLPTHQPAWLRLFIPARSSSPPLVSITPSSPPLRSIRTRSAPHTIRTRSAPTCALPPRYRPTTLLATPQSSASPTILILIPVVFQTLTASSLVEHFHLSQYQPGHLEPSARQSR
ncbi:hypothetical protein L1887_62141 [Cichorium endivia]|nr:hypothetical protein L1887_62141 [Cichorium endivia]